MERAIDSERAGSREGLAGRGQPAEAPVKTDVETGERERLNMLLATPQCGAECRQARERVCTCVRDGCARKGTLKLDNVVKSRGVGTLGPGRALASFKLAVLGGKQLQYHYDAEHSVRDPDIVTTKSFQCQDCKVFFARQDIRKNHVCPARQARRERESLEIGGWLPVLHGPA